MEEASIKTIDDGIMTKDLAVLTSLDNVKVANSYEFIKAIRDRLEAII